MPSSVLFQSASPVKSVHIYMCVLVHVTVTLAVLSTASQKDGGVVQWLQRRMKVVFSGEMGGCGQWPAVWRLFGDNNHIKLKQRCCHQVKASLWVDYCFNGIHASWRWLQVTKEEHMKSCLSKQDLTSLTFVEEIILVTSDHCTGRLSTRL